MGRPGLLALPGGIQHRTQPYHSRTQQASPLFHARPENKARGVGGAGRAGVAWPDSRSGDVGTGRNIKYNTSREHRWHDITGGEGYLMVAKTQAKECLMHHSEEGKIYVRSSGGTLRNA